MINQTIRPPDHPEFNHKHIILKAVGLKNVPRSAELIKSWLVALVDKVNMKVLMGPFAEYCNTPGNEGVTGVVVIETSHCSIHVWDNIPEPFLQMDLYSCADFEPAVVVNHVNHFEPTKVDYLVIDRNQSPMVVDPDGNAPSLGD